MPQTIAYHSLVKQLKEPEKLRENMVHFYFQNNRNASLTAREFSTKRQTVAKWVERFEQLGSTGLKDQSRAPNHHTNQLSPDQEEEILKLKRKMLYAGPGRLKAEGIAHSTSTIYRALKSHSLVKKHKKRWQVCLRDVIIQTDNGSENIGSIYAKKDSLLSLLVADYGATHKTIPVRSPRFNSHVESFHGIVEREFYSQEYLPTETELLAKATSYLWWFNLERKNLAKNKALFELIKQQTQILEPSFLNFPPIILDYLPWFAPALRAVPYVGEEGIKRGGSQTGQFA